MRKIGMASHRFWGVQRFPNNGTSLPQPTDILCFHNRPYGHVAIVMSVEGHVVNIIQENASADTAYGQVDIINGVVQNDCQGWLGERVKGEEGRGKGDEDI